MTPRGYPSGADVLHGSSRQPDSPYDGESKRNPAEASIFDAFSVLRRCIAVVGSLALGYGAAMAEQSHRVYLPLTFDTEARAIRTTACLQVNERLYPDSAWWEDGSGNAAAPDRALKAVIAAMKRKDRTALFQLSDPGEGRDPKRFDEQAEAFFRQLEVIHLVAVPRAYEFDGLVVFFGKFRSKKEMAFVPLAFAHEDDGSFGFLPYRTERLTYRLVNHWFDATWRQAATANPTYCTGQDVKRATHRISLASSAGPQKHAWSPSSLFLAGASFEKPGEHTDLVVRAKSAITEMKSRLVNDDVDGFVKHLTPEGGARLKQWFASADQTDRSRYRGALTEQEPFFLFDASPLVVVYTRSPRGIVQVMYFTLHPTNRLLWTNSSHLTTSDRVFKQGPLHDAALLDTPFKSIAIK